jgi:outer membrane protein OmpA-like peptidoglycan-associated protein
MKFLLTLVITFICAPAFSQRTDTLVIHFDFDKDEINAAAADILNNYFTADRTPRVTGITLYGHCDYIGDHAYNDALSERRVEQAKQYLVGKGLPESIFARHEGFGKRKPLNDNKTASDRLANRRVELIVHWQPEATVTAPPPQQPVKKDTPVSLTDIIKDTAIKEGRNIVLRNLQFEPGRHFLLPSSQPILDELYQVMADNPTLVIQIQGHVCCTPDNEDGLDLDDRTQDLSVKRARAVYNTLIERKIPRERLSFTGFGGGRKLYPLERDDFERQENRRVEIKIVRR